MKRGTSDYSLVIGVNKPRGMSSHDAVNRVRSVFGERRVGHTGTLDPLAEGVLPVCIGPATRLDRYMVGHQKRYAARVTFGFETNTCDSEGEVTKTADVPFLLRDEDYARVRVQEMIGPSMQVPPAFSAIKIDGKPAYKRARTGESIELEARPIEIYDADLVTVDIDEDGTVSWEILLEVSKGTYIRSLARDLGRSLGTCACMTGLQRMLVGNLNLSDCVTLETLESVKERAALDPVALLGFRYAFMDAFETKLANGNAFDESTVTLYEPLDKEAPFERCICTSRVCASSFPPHAEEKIAMICNNRLKAVYAYDAQQRRWKPDCIFSIGVFRG